MSTVLLFVAAYCAVGILVSAVAGRLLNLSTADDFAGAAVCWPLVVFLGVLSGVAWLLLSLGYAAQWLAGSVRGGAR